MYQRKRSIRLEADSDSRFDSPEDYFDAIGMDLPDSIRRSVPSSPTWPLFSSKTKSWTWTRKPSRDASKRDSGQEIPDSSGQGGSTFQCRITIP